VRQDYGEALAWFQKAAERGHPLAQYNLGNMYLKGQGTQQDPDAARKWFSKASKSGHKGARKALESMQGGG
jgi:hypothetical protein